ncbi:N-carbamoylsarcosine amidase protein [Rutstroemia sp. NJR-2017a BBW]|nr:N-carbamoylsarcosine amidase protein [Rutstroemia sp. NJR-2017a BBW]
MSVADGYTTLLEANYSRCYGKNQLRFGSSPALIVIDVVKAYHDPSSPLYAPERFDTALISIKNLISKCRSASIPVIFTSVQFDSPVAGGKWYMEKLPNVLCCFDKDNSYREFAEGVEPGKDELVLLKHPFVVREACGDRHAAVNDSNLFDMSQKFAEVVLEEEMMALIDGISKK